MTIQPIDGIVIAVEASILGCLATREAGVRQMMNARETMLALRISRATVRAMLAAGRLRGFRQGKVIRISRQSVEDLLGGSPPRDAGASDAAA